MSLSEIHNFEQFDSRLSHARNQENNLLGNLSQSSYSQMDLAREHEKQLVKFEGDVRTHIRVEQQLKIHLDNVLQKLEDMEKQHEGDLEEVKGRNKELQADKKRLEELIDLKTKEFASLQKQHELKQRKGKDSVRQLESKIDRQEKVY